jgi:pectin methylesterase-like acyl-CoA thioesterase
MQNRLWKISALLFLLMITGSENFLISKNIEKAIYNSQDFQKPNIVVAKDGTGNYKTIGQALANVPKGNSSLFVVFIKNGLYEEKILVSENKVMLIGESKESTKIIYPEQQWIWQCKNDPNDPLPAVVNVTGSDCIFINLTIKNNWGELHKNDPLPKLNCDIEDYESKVKPHGHQLAFKLNKEGTRLIILNCKIIADGADTFSPASKSYGSYIKDTYFEGYTDFVCPHGNCYISDSKFFNKGGGASLWHSGSTSKDDKLVVVNSSFDGIKDFKLGRYTHDAQMILINDTFSKNVADKKIYQAKPDVKWGERIYYYNCKREGGDFAWHKNNFSSSGYLPDVSKITAEWAFNGKWDPEKFIEKNKLISLYK